MRRLLIPVIAAFMLVGCGKKEPAVDIWTAAVFGNNGVIKQHIDYGTDVNAKNADGGSSPLIIAALFGHTETAKMLLENGADVNLQNNDGSTALHVAAFFCQPETVSLLLERGADLEVRNRYGQTPLETVSSEWSGDLEGVYKMVAEMWKLDLDLKRIQETRPQVADLISRHAGSQ